MKVASIKFENEEQLTALKAFAKAMKSSMTQSDTQRDVFYPCEDSMWPLKIKL